MIKFPHNFLWGGQRHPHIRLKGIISKKILKELSIFLAIYGVWNFYISIKNPHANLNNEALVPCLFYLPPLGLFLLYFTVIRYGVSAIRLWLKKRRAKHSGNKVI